MKPELQSMANAGAREAILESIRSHLALSKDLDSREEAIRHKAAIEEALVADGKHEATSIVELFKENVEKVDGHCLVVHNEVELVSAITDIVLELRTTRLSSLKVAVSDSSEVLRLVELMKIDLDDVVVTPS